MKQVCKFKKVVDIMQTRQGLAVNIPDALDFGRIVDTTSETMYNGQKSLSEVGTRIAEPFDAMEYDRAYTKVRHSVLTTKEDDEK